MELDPCIQFKCVSHGAIFHRLGRGYGVLYCMCLETTDSAEKQLDSKKNQQKTTKPPFLGLWFIPSSIYSFNRYLPSWYYALNLVLNCRDATEKKSKVLENFILIWSKKVETMQLIWLVKKYFLNKMKQGKGILLNRKKCLPHWISLHDGPIRPFLGVDASMILHSLLCKELHA